MSLREGLINGWSRTLNRLDRRTLSPSERLGLKNSCAPAEYNLRPAGWIWVLRHSILCVSCCFLLRTGVEGRGDSKESIPAIVMMRHRCAMERLKNKKVRNKHI